MSEWLAESALRTRKLRPSWSQKMWRQLGAQSGHRTVSDLVRTIPPAASNASSASRTGRTSWTRRFARPACQAERGADGRIVAIGIFVADQFAQETLSRMADEQRAAELVKPVAVRHQRDVVLVRFAEADAGIEANAFGTRRRRQ